MCLTWGLGQTRWLGLKHERLVKGQSARGTAGRMWGASTPTSARGFRRSPNPGERVGELARGAARAATLVMRALASASSRCRAPCSLPGTSGTGAPGARERSAGRRIRGPSPACGCRGGRKVDSFARKGPKWGASEARAALPAHVRDLASPPAASPSTLGPPCRQSGCRRRTPALPPIGALPLRRIHLCELRVARLVCHLRHPRATGARIGRKDANRVTTACHGLQRRLARLP